LRTHLAKIEVARARNAELRKKVKAVIDLNRKKKRKSPVHSFATPYFSATTGEIPPNNPDAIKRNQYMRSLPNGFKFKKWNQNEMAALANGVRTMNQRILWKRMMEGGRARTTEQLRREKEAIQNMSPEELEMNLDGLDWDAIAKLHVPTRTAMDCKIQWTQVQHPQICKKEFSKTEDQHLLALVKEHKGHDWVSVAQKLGTNRTPAQCLKRYQRSLNTSMMRGKWTAEEDKQLREAVRRYGQKNWQQVAHCLKDRTGQQCLHRWQKTLNPDIRRGRWSPTEDMRLTLAVKAYGRSPRWVMVQKHIPGRTDVQCRERWVNIINPALNNGPWSSDELKRLEEAVKLYGVGKWALVAKAMYPRTDNQCWRRWKAICAGEEVETYRENIRKKRKGLVNNFVGREKERPALTVEDFEIEEEHRVLHILTPTRVCDGLFCFREGTPISFHAHVNRCSGQHGAGTS